MEKLLKRKEGLKWYEVTGSYLNHNMADIIRKGLGISAGYDLAMLEAEDRAHKPPPGYHTFYTDQIDMGL